MSWAEPSRLPSGGRRNAQRPAAGVAHAVGQVRVPTRDPLEGERQLHTGNVLGEPGFDSDPVDALRSLGSAVGRACSLVAHSRASIFPTPIPPQPVDRQSADDRLRDRLCGADRPCRDRGRPLPPAAPGLRERHSALLPGGDRRPQPAGRRGAPRSDPSGDRRPEAQAPAAARRHRRGDSRHGAAGRRRPDRRPDRGGAALHRPDRHDAATAGGAGRRLGPARRRRPGGSGQGRRTLGDRRARRSLQRNGR